MGLCGMRLHALTCALAVAVLNSAAAPEGGENLGSQGYNQWVMSQWASQAQGDVGGIAMTATGDVAVSKAPGATVNIDANTVFEVGSTTKTFATLAAELLADQGKLSMHAAISTYLPASVKMTPAVAAITLRELVSHTSGLERMPSNINPKDQKDPMADYTKEDLYAYLSGLNQLGPKKFLYSNTGFGLLGWITCLVSGKGWEELIKELILDPLGMSDTSVTLSDSQKARLAPPYSKGVPSNLCTFTDAFVGAGGLRSTATDMLTYTKAHAGLISVNSTLRKAMDRMQVPIAEDEFASRRGKVCEAFQKYTTRLQDVLWKDGETYGFNCMMSFQPGKTASVVFANTATSSVALATNLIVAGKPPQRERIQVPLSSLMRDVGTFKMPPDVLQPGDYFQVQTTYQDSLYVSSQRSRPVEVFPFGQDQFFNMQVGLEVVFPDAGTLLLFYSGLDQFADRTRANTPSEMVRLFANTTWEAELAHMKLRSLRI